MLRLVRALARQTVAPETFEVVVSVDGSTDGSLEALGALDVPFALNLVAQENHGRAAAVNRGIVAATGRIVLLLDDDMEPEPECLAAHLAAHEDGAPRCVVGAVPVVAGHDAPAVTRYVAGRFDRHSRRLEMPGHAFGLRDFYSGHCSLERATLVELGAFEESFRVYGNEDLELFFRLRRAGVPVVFEPSAVARQHFEKSFAQLARHTVAKGETAVLLLGLHPETYPELQLAGHRLGSRPWLCARRALVRAARLVDPVGPVALLAAAVERFRPDQCERLYGVVTNYLYWVGVDRALRRNRAAGSGPTRLPV